MHNRSAEAGRYTCSEEQHFYKLHTNATLKNLIKGQTDHSQHQHCLLTCSDSFSEQSHGTKYTGWPFLHKALMVQSEILVIFTMSVLKKTFSWAFRLSVWKDQLFLPAATQKNNKIISEEK